MVSFTVITNANGPAAKVFRLDADGNLDSKTSAKIYNGTARIVTAKSLRDFVTLRRKLPTKKALCYGLPNIPRGEDVLLLTGKTLQPGAIARDKKHFAFQRGKPGIWMLDLDAGSQPQDWRALDTIISNVLPGWSTTARVWLPSSSAFIYAGERELIGLGGWRAFMIVDDADKIPALTDYLFQALWAAGHGYAVVNKAGAIHARTILDRSVAEAWRLDFNAPVLRDGLERRVPDPAFVDGAEMFVTGEREPVPMDEWRSTDEAWLAAKAAKADESGKAQKAQVIKLRKTYKTKVSAGRMSEILRKAVEEHTLTGDFELELEDGGRITIAELLDRGTEDYDGVECPDPLEPDYRGDRRIAIIMLRPKRGHKPAIYSHAHGGQLYFLEPNSGELIIIVQGKRDRGLVEAMQAVRRHGGIFARDSILMRVGSDGKAVQVVEHWLAGYLDRNFHWEEWYFNKVAQKMLRLSINVPEWLVKRFLAQTGEWKLQTLKGVITSPTMRADGSILAKKGYDAGTQLFLSGGPFVNVPLEPTQAQLQAAFATLWYPFSLFPLDGPDDKAALLAALLTGVCRRTLAQAPAIIIEAPVPGCGKTEMAMSVQIISAGEESVITEKADPTEFDKALTGNLLEGSSALLFDNVKDGTGFNSTLEAFLTAPIYKARILGLQIVVRFPTDVLLLITKNNWQPSGDLWRRVLTVRIDPKVEAPERRTFAFLPSAVCKEQRQELVAAALTLLRGFVAAGSPHVTKDGVASYEDWNDRIRQCCLWLAREGVAKGFGDPIACQARIKAEDPKRTVLRDVMQAIWDLRKDAPWAVGDLLLLAADNAELKAVLLGITPIEDDAVGIGRWLAGVVDQRLDGKHIERGEPDKHRKIHRWRIVAGV